MKKSRLLIAAVSVLILTMTAGVFAASAAELGEADDVVAGQVIELPIDDDEDAPDYPEITGFENTAEGVKVTWNAYPGADSYRLFYWNGEKWRSIGSTSALSMLHKTAENDTMYIYTVRAEDEWGEYCSDFNREGYENAYIAPPVITSIQNKNDGVELKWDYAVYADKYRVYRKSGGGSWKRIADTDNDSFVDSNVVSGTTYSYTLRTINEDATDWTSSYNEGKSITYVATPQITGLENLEDGVKITFSHVSGAAKYGVFYLGRSGWKGLGVTTSNTIIDDVVSSGSTYTYTVRALDSKGNFVSGFNTIGWDQTFVAPPTLISVKSGENGVDINWELVKGGKNYRVYRKTDSTGWGRVGTVTGDTFTDVTAVSGNKYYYTVRCIDDDGETFVSKYVSIMSLKYIKAPVITDFTNTEKGIKITWEKSEGAAKYGVFYMGRSGWKGLAVTSGNSVVDDDVNSGVTYKYTVRCLDSKGNFISDYIRSGFSYTFVAPPRITSVVSNGLENTVTWNEVKGASAYRLYRKTRETSWSRLFDYTEKTSFIDRTAAAGKAYAYTVRCLDENGELISDYVFDGKFYKDGDPDTGFAEIDGKKYYFLNGKIVKGKGIVGSKTAGYAYANADGEIVTSREIQDAVDFIMTYGAGSTREAKLSSCFKAMQKYPYSRVYGIPTKGEDFSPLAIKMFEEKTGNCYCYAAAFSCIAKVLGYDTKVVTGQIKAAAGGLTAHGWTEIYIDGGWYIYDVDMQIEIPTQDFYGRSYTYYPVQPLNPEKKFTLTILGNKAVWS
ncbi:MAG: hypothetical protein IIZ36_04365 [Ruminococcus sp.]|nr:hypothetical protein [Ruminococcus sp.]